MSIKRDFAEQIKLFFAGKPCSFPAWKELQQNYNRALNNLGSGCTPCKRNALKRKFAAKIRKLIELKYANAAKLRSGKNE